MKTEILNLEGADKLIASIVHQAAEDFTTAQPRCGYRSARRFLDLAGLLHDDQLDARLHVGHVRRRNRN
jgi:hypothetical protein